MKKLNFDRALRLAAEALQHPELTKEFTILIVRDIYGRLRFAVNAFRARSGGGDSASEFEKTQPVFPHESLEILLAATRSLGPYATAQQVIFRDDFSQPEAFFSHPDIQEMLLDEYEDDEGEVHSELTILLLDRQVVGQDWLRTKRQRGEGQPPRVVFYGLKGGVGRSTSLAMLAFLFAKAGKNVLLLDFDLESPGLSGLLLPTDRVPESGIVNWFIEDAIVPDDRLLNEMISDSPLAEHLDGRIRVVPAMGQADPSYLAKLSRVYGDVPTPRGPERFAARMARLVEALEAKEKPDVVLIDSRAGLHDLAAVSISTLADLALLFATDNEQSWQGYEQLLKHWRQRPNVLRGVRERLWLVRAMFPEANQEELFERFVQRAYDLFSENLYDDLPASDDEQANDDVGGLPIDAFAYDMMDEEAPHFPLIVRWNARFMEFSPVTEASRGGVSEADIQLAFGAFAQRVNEILFGV
ncbi:ParA family protein [Burkholderia cepacia]|uniref:ParA family protein n=1 Tax=Burkholderia cepacia TaxID=292 RepID=UPI002FE261F1